MARMTLTAKALGASERPYDSFTGNDGSAVPAGITRILHVWDSEQCEHLQVKVPPALAEQVAAVKMDFGTEIAMEVSTFAQGRRVEYRLQAPPVVVRAGVRAAS